MSEALAQLAFFEDLPDDEQRWIREHGYEVALEQGAFFFIEHEPVHQFYIVLEGELQVTRTFFGTRTVLGTTPPGIIGGEMALLSRTVSNVTSRAILPSRLLVLDEPDFRALFGACPVAGARVLEIAFQRTQGVAFNVKQQEKMAALGKLSAGLAHELNNPAAAARSSASSLRETLAALQAQSVRLNALALSSTQLEQLVAFQQQAAERATTLPRLAPLEQSDRESEIGDWLDDQGIANSWELAATFVNAGLTLDDLLALTEPLPADNTSDVLVWLCQSLSVTHLLDEVQQSVQRISTLVGAVKDYTYMDQAAVQEVDLHKDLENTLRMLNHKLRDVTVIREFAADLPLIWGRGSDLNQVWTNIIDNAIDATAGRGEIHLITRNENDYVMVEIADNGTGIPAEVLPRIFEPFFTTKDVGSGTGLGLDISYNSVRQHGGTLEAQSQPGHTRFIVRLPVGAPPRTEPVG